MSLLVESTDKHKGKQIFRFEDEDGNELDDLYMLDSIIIVFMDGSKLKLGGDCRGTECYISQYVALGET